MDIQLTINEQPIAAVVSDGPAARDFLALLPLTLTLEDYAATEKVAQLPTRLSTAGEPEGLTPSIGDVTYYTPWGNLAIFYKGFGYADGLVKLGHITGDMSVFRGPGPLKAHIAIVRKN